MARNKNIRDMIYVSHNQQSNCFYSYGIEFHEFMNCIENPPDNLLLLQHRFDNAQWNYHSRFDYVTKLEMNELIADNVNGYGDFCWVDFANEENLDSLSHNEIAELLFFGHLAKPLNEIPKIRFAYYAHDDGWFNKLYVTDLHDYEVLLARVITRKLQLLKNTEICAISNDIASQLMRFTLEGMFIDLLEVVENETGFKIPIAFIGHFTDMDHVYDYRSKITDAKIWLVHSIDGWKLDLLPQTSV